MSVEAEPDQETKPLTRFQLFRGKVRDGLVRIVWVVLLMFFSQNAVASRLENEPRAALLYWMFTAIVVLVGGISVLNRRARLE